LNPYDEACRRIIVQGPRVRQYDAKTSATEYKAPAKELDPRDLMITQEKSEESEEPYVWTSERIQDLNKQALSNQLDKV
jgi:hypothetical protein